MVIGHNSGNKPGSLEIKNEVMDVKEITKELLKRTISNYLNKKKVTTFSPLDHIFPNERKIRSIIGGLETSIGTKFWEKLAKEIALKNGFEVLNEKDFNKSVPAVPDTVRQEIVRFEEKKKTNSSEKQKTYFNQIKRFIKKNKIRAKARNKIPKGSGVDIWLKKDNAEYLIDIKTVQINAGDGNKFNKHLLEWYTYRALDEIPDTNCWIVFPYNPHPNDYWQKEKAKVAPLLPQDEALVENEFWNFLSNKKETYKDIEAAFKELGTDEAFVDQFRNLFANSEPQKELFK